MLKLFKQGDFEFVREGAGEPMILLHGLFGALSNWQSVVNYFADKGFEVFIPLLPIYEGDFRVKTTVESLADHVKKFTEELNLTNLHLVGNSLGGHIALIYTLKYQNQVKTITLTGSSGLFEAGMGSSFPKRKSREFIRERVEFTFYDPKTATLELVNEVFGIINNRIKALRVIKIAKNAQRTNLANELHKIKVPTCLIWGLNDNITPPYVAHEFHKLIPNSKLYFIDKCGHAPMMEQPEKFNNRLEQFLSLYNTHRELQL